DGGGEQDGENRNRRQQSGFPSLRPVETVDRLQEHRNCRKWVGNRKQCDNRLYVLVHWVDHSNKNRCSSFRGLRASEGEHKRSVVAISALQLHKAMVPIERLGLVILCSYSQCKHADIELPNLVNRASQKVSRKPDTLIELVN